MQVPGTVLEVKENNRILVEIVRQSACGGNCHSCGSCGGTESKIIAECTDNVKVGDRVLVAMPNNRYFLLSFLVFLVPLFMIVAGYVVLSKFLPETPASLGAILVGIATFLAIVLGMRKLKMPKAYLDSSERGKL